MTKDTSGPAFPRPAVFTPTLGLASVELDGMTLRQWYAGLAMQGIAYSGVGFPTEGDFDAIAKTSFAMADAMIAEGSKQ